MENPTTFCLTKNLMLDRFLSYILYPRRGCNGETPKGAWTFGMLFVASI
jgi:hypothetical protein